MDWRLYLLLDIGLVGDRDPLALAEAALTGGVTVIQMRAKNWPARRQVELATALLAVTKRFGVPLIINDQLDVALAVGAAGVHLGVDDLPVAAARRLWPDGLIGYSPEGVGDARRAVTDGADHLGVGPFAATATKGDAGPAIGAAGLQAITSAVTVPVIAVGGIGEGNVGAAMAAGAAGVAVGSAIVRAADPAAAARRLRGLIDAAILANH